LTPGKIGTLYIQPHSFGNLSPLYLSVNIQSLNSKHEELSFQICELLSKNISIDVIALQETWNVQYPDQLLIPGFQHPVIINRYGMRGGGVGFYVKNGLDFKILEHLSPFENKIFESLTIQLSYPGKHSVLLTTAYRSNGPIPNVTPSQQMDRFLTVFDELLQNLSNNRLASYIFMDSNIDLLNLRNNDSSNLLDTALSHGFLQCVVKSTRMQNRSKTLIDHIFTSLRSCNMYTGTLISDISDHFFTFIQTPSPISKIAEKTKTSRLFNERTLNNFKAALGGANWEPVTCTNDVNIAYDEFWSIYTELFELTFPLKTMRFNKNIHTKNPFMTAGLLKSRETKNHLYHLTLSDPSAESKTRYKNFKTLYFKTVRAAKKQYYRNKLNEHAKNPKKTWETLNEITGKGGGSDSVDKLSVNGVLITNPAEIATEFNKFFTGVGSRISNSVPPVTKPPEDYIDYNREIPRMGLGNTTPEHIKKVICSLAAKNSCDIQGTNTKMIKFLSSQISVPLSHIFNLSLTCGEFPAKLKTCRVIPIHKSGSRLDCDNYRPISLLSSVSKILEKIVAEKLITHLLTNNLLYNNQYGFLPNRSTEQNLIQILNYITTAFNEGSYCIGVFLDLRKAFDVCSHEILLKKLEKMGISGTTHKWFTSYLSGRSQCVDISGSLSDFIELAISVIQGSTLGPLLFLCYINDLWSATTLFSILFADDTTCLAKGKVLSELTLYVNQELQKIANWFRSNKMAVNTSKTKFIVFRTHGKYVNPDDCKIMYNSTELGLADDPLQIMSIDRVSNESNEKSFKLLGVLFDEYLSFEPHIKYLCSQISKSLYCINRVKNFIDLSSLKKLYFAMIHSKLAYCLNVYSCASNATLSKLIIKQKQAIRTISSASYRAHTAPLFQQLNILPLEKLIISYRLKFMHSYHFKKLPLSFAELWITNQQRIPERVLRDADDYYIPPHRIEIVKRMPLFTFPLAWNDADDIKYNPVQHLFMRDLKNILLLPPLNV
jgi:exonuclease III